MIDGTDQTFAPVNKRGIGVVWQTDALFPHMTVAETVAFPLKIRGMAAGQIAPRVEKGLETVGLEHALERFPVQLSGGQQPRVALARCLVHDPSIILMDEPPGALDPKLREIMQIEMKRIHRETGATIIFVTHDQKEALALSDRTCLMSDGKIARINTPRKIYAKPQSLFVADVIGRPSDHEGAGQDLGHSWRRWAGRHRPATGLAAARGAACGAGHPRGRARHRRAITIPACRNPAGVAWLLQPSLVESTAAHGSITCGAGATAGQSIAAVSGRHLDGRRPNAQVLTGLDQPGVEALFLASMRKLDAAL